MTSELKRTQPVHRGALLEAVATILEWLVQACTPSAPTALIPASARNSHNLSIASLDGDEADQKRFRSAMVNILDFAIEKLNDKGASRRCDSCRLQFPVSLSIVPELQPSMPTRSFSPAAFSPSPSSESTESRSSSSARFHPSRG